MVLLFFFKNIPPIPVFTLFATVHYWDDFSNVSTGTGRGRRRILRVWGLGREPQQARKAGAQRKIFRKWRAICPACHFCGKGNLARHLHCLPNLPFEKIFSICETKCPCVPYYPYREIFLYWKKFPRILDFLSLLAILPIWEGFRKFFRRRWNKNAPRVLSVLWGEKYFGKFETKQGCSVITT